MSAKTFLKRWVAGAIVALAALPSLSFDEIRYEVQPGDTLIGLGEALLARPADWVVLQRLNGIVDDRRIPIGTQLRIPVRLLRPVPREAEVVEVTGHAQANDVLIVEGDRIGAGVTLQTGETGHVVIRLPDGSELSLPARSRARIDTLQGYAGTDTQDLGVDLEQGRVESRVVPQRGPAARYRIDTPTAVIGVRGTDFRVSAAPEEGASRAEVTSGTIRVVRAGPAPGPARDLTGGFGLVARSGERLPAPVPLLEPPAVDALPVLFERPLLRIEPPALAGASAFRVQVRATGTRAMLFDEVFSGQFRIAGLDDGAYVMRLRGVDADGIEGQDAEHRFTLKARPEPPFMSMPRADGKAPAGVVRFEWAAAPEAGRYHLQVAEVGDASVFIHDDVAVAGTAAEVKLEPGLYTWRIASIRPDGDRGPWSDAAGFEVRPPPSEPEPPEMGDEEMVFRWSGEPGQRFDVEFASDPDFSRVIHSASTELPEWAVAKPGPDTYWIRVRAIDPDGFVGPWTAGQSVIVPARFPWWMLLLPLLAL
ncbi:FecR domain-containing protein [Azoarcus taiwanensis]|uniref:LysM domain-containing protein n=1 Tax=Azoarcus taiwanensis TaxID=666964 RepID=A0A972F7F2_9RHOO|nr:FecR domain-containing protein [Azoarcus taiwanensis]NMG02675.1 hypothetical protein [Azoarcus taiwanensis]